MEDLSSVYNDIEVDRGVKHTHKKRKLTDGREKTMVFFFHYSDLYYYFFSQCGCVFLMLEQYISTRIKKKIEVLYILVELR